MRRARTIFLSTLLVSSVIITAVGAVPGTAVSSSAAVVMPENVTTSSTAQSNATLSLNTTQVSPNETIRFTLTAIQGTVWLLNPKPYVVQRRVGERWQTVYTPAAPTIIPPPIEPGESRSWTFSPRQLNDPRPGEYRVKFTTTNANFSETVELSSQFQVVGGMSLALQPSENLITTNDTVTLDVVVQNATDGVSDYDLSIFVSGVSLAIPGEGLAVEVVSVRDRSGAGSVVADIGPNNETATILAAGANVTVPESTLATVTVVGMRQGEATVTLTRANVTDRDGSQYGVVTVENASVKVSRGGPPPIRPLLDPPTDPNGDGLYEDVNGDGRFTIIDVAVLLDTFDSAIVKNNATAFDFNNDGEVTIIDVATLLDEV